MPGAAIADLEMHESSGDLIAATHGRGMYKINLSPLHAFLKRNGSPEKDFLFEPAACQLPWFQSASGTPDYRSFEKTDFVFWLGVAKPVTLSLKDKANKTVWSIHLQGEKGFNQYRWDMIMSRQTSNLPYFTQYEEYLKAGAYTLILSDGQSELSRPFKAIENQRPHSE
jgi:hypothetical protein